MIAMIDKDKVLEDLKQMRNCANAYCPDHDCGHCKYHIEDKDEQVAVLDIVTAIVNSVVNLSQVCPLNQLTPCVNSCAWYDSVNDTCMMKRRITK